MKFFDSIPKWQTLTNCEKFMLVCADICYSAITLGLPAGLSFWTESPITFFGVASVEAACCAPPLLPGMITAMSVFKRDPNRPFSDHSSSDEDNISEDDMYRAAP